MLGGKMTILSTLALCLLQNPFLVAEKDVAADDVVQRFLAAQQLAYGDEAEEKWLLREIGKGTSQRQRALLLAAALRGSPDCFDLLEQSARKGRKTDPTRAFALLLYGQFHPQAGKNFEKDWARCSSEYERACFLVGLLAKPEMLCGPELGKRIQKQDSPALLALRELAIQLASPQGLAKTQSPYPEAAIFASLLLMHTRLNADWLQSPELASLPLLWRMAALRKPPRSSAWLQEQVFVGPNRSAVLALYEIDPKQRQKVLDVFLSRAMGDKESAWLWGAAGELGLELPFSEVKKLANFHIAGITQLALRDEARAKIAAEDLVEQARQVFLEETKFEQVWASAVVMALVGEPVDLALLQKKIGTAKPSERHQLAPIWKFAQHSLGSLELRRYWLRQWSRELGAGRLGFFDQEVPRWLAFVLSQGSLEAENNQELHMKYSSIPVLSMDYALDHPLYTDVVAFLLSGHYRVSFSE